MIRSEDLNRFIDKIQFTDTCWLWTSSLDESGYGMFWFDGKSIRSHVLSFLWFSGPIPEGMTLDHFLRNKDRTKCKKHCVNPDHIEPVPQGVNAKRGAGWHRDSSGLLKCKRGHSLSDNPIITKNGGRACRECHYLSN